jgi:hypothetical protein
MNCNKAVPTDQDQQGQVIQKRKSICIELQPSSPLSTLMALCNLMAGSYPCLKQVEITDLQIVVDTGGRK